MDDPGPVNTSERLGETSRQGKDGLDRQRTVVMHRIGERRPWHVRRAHPRQLRLGIGIDDSGRVYAADVLRGGDLPSEPGPETAFLSQLRPDHLDCDKSAALRPRQVDLAHSASAQPPEQTIRPNRHWVAMLQFLDHC